MKIQRMAFLLALVPVLFLAGCGTKSMSVSKYGMAEAKEAISVENPVEIERRGELFVTVFPIIVNPGNWGTESIPYKNGEIGTWPILSSKKGNGAIIKGYYFIANNSESLLNDYGSIEALAISVGRKDDIDRVLPLSRGGDTIQTIGGKEFSYDSKKFDEDLKYQVEIFNQKGKTIKEIEDFWMKYNYDREIEIPSGHQFVEEIQVGSARWEDFKSEIAQKFGKNYQMSDGQFRSTHISSEEDFLEKAYKNQGVTGGQRFMREFKVSLNPIVIVSSLLNGIIASSIGPEEGFYAFSEAPRGDMKGHFNRMSEEFQILLAERDMIIKKLKSQLGNTGR
ncbi:MAG: hypothetical protein EOM84_00325 [Sphingobacteriia bacterium]|nr:hypothetical protein [Sphingobacteriia bacterium]